MNAAVALLALSAAQPQIVDGDQVPVHRSVHGGLWSAGRDFKASFHDGFTFYPLVGVRSPNRPWTWRTRAVRRGTDRVALAAPATTFSATHVEIDHGGVREVYDVVPAGVEQSFVLASALAGDGDLVIEARLETELRGELVGGELVFRDAEGEPLVRYGAARAFDAAGRVADVVTRFAGDRVELVVAGGWLDAAELPVTVDPLVYRGQVSYSPAGLPAATTDVGRDPAGGPGALLMVGYARQFAVDDFDAYVRVTDDSWSNGALVFADTDVYSTETVRVALVNGAARWVIALEHTDGSTGVWAHFHPRGSTAFAATQLRVVSGAATVPDVGGMRAAGTRALIACEVAASGGTAELTGVLLDAAAGSAIGSVPLTGGPKASGADRRRPAVSPLSDGNTASWLVAWQEHDGTGGDDWDIRVSRVRGDGTFHGEVELGDVSGPPHSLAPRLGGGLGRYLVAWVERANTGKYAGDDGDVVRAARVDWSDGATIPTAVGTVTVDSAGMMRPGGVAFDTATASHWAVAYTSGASVRAARLGFSPCVVETVVAYDSPGNIGIGADCAYDTASRGYALTWASDELAPTPYPIFGDRFVHAAAAANTLVGTACGPGTISAGIPRVGNEFFFCQLDVAAPDADAWLLFASAPGSVDLAVIGRPGCFVNADPASIFFVDAVGATSAAGSARTSFRLPDCPPNVFASDLYLQWVYADPAAPPALPISFTRGIRCRVR